MTPSQFLEVFFLLFVVSSGVALIALIVFQQRLERRWEEEDRKRNARFTSSASYDKPEDTTRWHQ